MARNEVSIVIKARNLATKAINMVSKGIKRLSRVARGMGRVTSLGFRMLRNGVLVAAAAMGGMIKHANGFRKQMALVSTMLRGNGMRSMREYTREVIRLSAELGLAKSELAEGLYQTLSAGIPSGNALEFLAIAAKSAVAGATDVATAVDGLTTIINSYGLAAEEASRVSDVMFAIVRDGKVTYGELAENISKVAPIAKVAGIELEEVGATIAALVRLKNPNAP